MQRGFRKIDTWCKSKGLSVNPEKTKVVLLQEVGRPKEVAKLEYPGVKSTTKEAKYLGVTLDGKTDVENTCREWDKEKDENSVVWLYIHRQNPGLDSYNDPVVL